MKSKSKDLHVRIDECMPPSLVEALKALPPGKLNPVIQHIVRDLYGEGLADEVWLKKLVECDHGLVITHDRGKSSGTAGGIHLPQICRDEGIAHVLVSSSIAKLTGPRKIEIMAQHWSHMQQITTKIGRGEAYHLVFTDDRSRTRLEKVR